MSLAARMLGPRQSAEVSGLATERIDQAHWLADLIGGRSATGQQVTVDLALKLDTVIACVKLYSETIGGFPLKLYRLGAPSDVTEREEVPGHPNYELLHSRPNRTMPPVTFWGLGATHLATWGECFLGKRFVAGRVDELWVIDPIRVRVELKNREKLYWVRGPGGVEESTPYTAGEIIHVIGFTQSGMRGISPITLARESIGAGLAMDEYANRFFANGAVPTGVLETDAELTNDGHNRLRRDWERRHKGRRNAHRIAILEQGLKYHAISMPLKDLEFVALHSLSAQKVCRIFGVPASMVDAEGGGHSKGMTYRNVETDNMRWLGRLNVSLKRIAQTLSMDADICPPRDKVFAEHVTDELLRMDALTEAQVYTLALAGRPWMQPTEVRRRKNLPPAPELDKLPPVPVAAVPPDGSPVSEPAP